MRRTLTLLFLALWLASALLAARVHAKSGEVLVLRVSGTIVPVVADYLDRGIDRAEDRQAAAVVIVLDTPGGLLEPTRTIVDRILNARVPVVVYVSPWAASAGTFITLAAHVAAMSPSGRMGAASPVAMGQQGEQQMSPTMERKIMEDTVTWIRNVAKLRGRDQDKAELTVRDGKSYDVDEALTYRLADLKSASLEDLLRQIDGREVTLSGGEKITLHTAGVTPVEMAPNWVERFLQTISNPNLAYVLLTLAMIGLIAEFSNPGMIFPGVAGGISLLLAFYSLGVLDAYWGGVLLIMLAFGLFIAELFTASTGILLAGGITSFIMGSLLLFSGRSPMFRVDPWLIALTTILITAFFVFIVAAIVKAHQHRAITGREGMVGQEAVALTRLAPEGTVMIEGERWTAETEGDIVEPGERVVVERMSRLKLTVRKAQDSQAHPV